MTNQEKIAFKIGLKNFGGRLLTERITTAQAAMDQAQEAANAEEKSSSGDKYETGRAMGQLQKEMYGRQLAEYAREVKGLQAVGVDTLCTRGGVGAFIRCPGMGFFISAGLGKQTVDGVTVLFVSPLAPLSRLLEGKGPGDSIMFNGNAVVIDEIY